MKRIPFNKPYLTGNELNNIAKAHDLGQLSGDGQFTGYCNDWLENSTGCRKALLTHSCTAALEISAMLLDLSPGDEVIMPSFTFVSTANAFALRGAIPVFVDIREDTLNINEKLIENAITEKTRAIVVVHYAGVSCEMDEIVDIASRHGLYVIEDAAQGILSTYRGKPLGGIGDLGCYSFHETKNIISGEGGALLVNNPDQVERAEIIREKGTNRSNFFRGMIDKYTWVDFGSSYLPGEIVSAFLWAQMKMAENITQKRLQLWNRYHEAFLKPEKEGRIRRPIIPAYCEHNAHMYYLLLDNQKDRNTFIEHMSASNIQCVFHYIPLHSSPKGAESCRVSGDMSNTENLSDCIVRLPLWYELDEYQESVIKAAMVYFS